MRAAVLGEQGRPLVVTSLPDPVPGPGQLLVAVEACAVCRTDLHLRDAEIDAHGLPRILGHQIVGRVVAAGPSVAPRSAGLPAGSAGSEESAAGPAEAAGSAVLPAVGDRVGIPWLAWTCGECRYCVTGRENLCVRGRFTGRDVDGGYAELTVADARFCLPLPAGPAADLAPLLCGGMIGYRALRLAGEGVERLGLYGFGSAAHLICQVARRRGIEVFAFVRRGDEAAAALGRSLGATWAGPSDGPPPARLDAAIIFASAGPLVPLALRAVAPGGTVVCAGIHMTDIPSFAYADLWEERSVRSVANLTRDDGRALLAEIADAPVVTHRRTYPLDGAEAALADLRAGAFVGSAVLEIGAYAPASSSGG